MFIIIKINQFLFANFFKKDIINYDDEDNF